MSGWRHGLGIAVAALALLVAGSLLQRWLPDPDDDPGAEPHLVSAGVGEEMDLRTATVTVDSVEGSRTVEDFSGDQVSPGVWVVVRYTVVARRENTPVTFAELVDDAGRTWGLGSRNDNDCPAGPPALPTRCTARFEVPLDALPSLRLRLARSAKEVRFDAMADVDLGLTADDADRFAAADPLVLP